MKLPRRAEHFRRLQPPTEQPHGTLVYRDDRHSVPPRGSFLVFAEKGLQETYSQKYLLHELDTTNSIPLKELFNK